MAPEQVFADLKVVDFSWGATGPLVAKNLGDHGATVIHVESARHIDLVRLSQPYAGGKPGANRSGLWAEFETSKLGMTVDITHPEGKKVAWRLLKWADVIIESFTPRVMPSWGMDYANVVKVNPSVIMVSTNMQGQTGPFCNHPGYGNLLAALSGFYHLAGWPDRGPIPTVGAYTDFIACHFVSGLLLAAIDHRRRTGEGQHIDVSQFEAAVHLLTPLLLDCDINGHEWQRMGNRSPWAAPHGVFPCTGDDRWLAIVIETDEQWQALCRAMGEPDWCHEERFTTMLGRLQNVDDLERHVQEWTQTQEPETAMQLLQEAGVPAGVAATGEDLHKDPQLAHREHLARIGHPEMGDCAYSGFAFKLSRTPGNMTAAPCMGEHNGQVYREILGYSDEEMADLYAAGVVQ